MALQRFFFPGGAISATRAPVVATRAPTPSPVRNLITPNMVVVVIKAVTRHADGEPSVGGQHHLAAAEDVADAAGEQGTDQHADQRVAAQCSGDRRVSPHRSGSGSFKKVGTTVP